MANLGNYPSTPAFSGVNFKIETTTQQTTSLSQKRYRNSIGTTFFTATAQYPPMTKAEFRPVMAFLAKCQGPLNEFDIVLPEVSENLGDTAGSTPEVNGDQAATSTTISMDGFAFSVNVLKAGDLIRFTNHTKVYMVTDDVTSSGTGTATVNITPALISGVSNNEAVTINNVPFRMTLANDGQEISIGTTEFYQYEIDLIEVL